MQQNGRLDTIETAEKMDAGEEVGIYIHNVEARRYAYDMLFSYSLDGRGTVNSLSTRPVSYTHLTLPTKA